MEITAVSLAHDGRAHAEPMRWLVPLLVVITSSGLYLLGTSAYRARRGREWSVWRTMSWLAGTAAVALALSPALTSATSEARGHMVQHLLLGMLAPIGLVVGAPVTLLLGSTGSRVGRRVTRLLRSRAFHALSHPITAAVLNVGGMYALYLTSLYALSAQSGLVHHLVHAHFLVAGYLYTWAIAGPDPAPRRPRLGTRLAVLVVAAGAHSHLGKLLYARAGELPPGSGYTTNQMETAAQWMYYGGDIAELLLVTALFAAWHAERVRRRSRLAAAGGPRSAGDSGQ